VGNVVVHEDDDILVLQPTLLHDLVRVAHVRLHERTA
jgi:hypothetical protein